MSSDLRELYQQVILDHNRNPRNFKELPNATKRVEGYNPLCGDHYTVFIELDGDVIKDISFLGSGCAISKASASILTDALKGKTKAEVKILFEAPLERFQLLIPSPQRRRPWAAIVPSAAALREWTHVGWRPTTRALPARRTAGGRAVAHARR